jgi:catechol 2,3-dioxygenase-like lactoylglutathione lyase family enzyme
MTLFQLSVNVHDVEESVAFYEKLLGVAPAKHRPGYANFVVSDPPLKLVLIEGEGEPGTINHVGIEVADADSVIAETRRIAELGLPFTVDETHTCCFATQDKVWSQDPNGVPWEIYTVVSDTEEFGARAH